MPSPAANSRHLFQFLRSALHIQADCRCQDCGDALSGRSLVIQQLDTILPPGQGCPFKRGGRALLGMLLKREQSLDPRLVTDPLVRIVDILRQCRDPATSRAIWALLQHFKFDNSPISGTHLLGYDYTYNEHRQIVWAISPLNNEISQARKEDIRELRRLGHEMFVETYHDIPTTRLDLAYWDWESQN